jgi:rare lipoprotein A (peptidoglycan hydrolase)
MKAQDGSVSENGSLHAEVSQLVSPPQPRNRRGEIVCTRNRYVQNERQVGQFSWYGGDFQGKVTASGEVFNKHALTIAHLTLPMGTRVLVENPDTGVAVQARVNDCGPFIKGRIADLSQGLAEYLGLIHAGTGRVIITVL